MQRPSEILIAKLEARQDAAEQSDHAFAERLGIGRPTWTLIRNRHPRGTLGLKFIAGTLRAYDDLEADVLKFLREEPDLMEKWAQPVPA